MKREPTPRSNIYDLYWYFANERQASFARRIAGESGPWTEDPILQTYKFCNVFRAADRVSQFLIRDVAYHDEACSPEDRLFQIVAFRTFSNIATWRGVRELLGHHPTLDDLSQCHFREALDEVRASHGKLYTGAFILCATDAYGHQLKHHNHIELFRHMFLQGGLGERLLSATSLFEVYQLLHEYPLMGDFMSYQIAIDLNYTQLVNFSENDFTQPGPGALRGIKKAFEDTGDYTPSEAIQWMVERQHEEFSRLDLPFQGLWGRPLHAIDCQGLFCELDKYCRVAAPELASSRKRIKAKFVPSSDPLPLFFPPKWGLNSRLPSVPAEGSTRTAGTAQQSALF